MRAPHRLDPAVPSCSRAAERPGRGPMMDALRQTRPRDNPWPRETDDLLRGLTGGFLVGIPLRSTTATWWSGQAVSTLRTLTSLVCSDGIILVFVAGLGFRGRRPRAFHPLTGHREATALAIAAPDDTRALPRRFPPGRGWRRSSAGSRWIRNRPSRSHSSPMATRSRGAGDGSRPWGRRRCRGGCAGVPPVDPTRTLKRRNADSRLRSRRRSSSEARSGRWRRRSGAVDPRSPVSQATTARAADGLTGSDSARSARRPTPRPAAPFPGVAPGNRFGVRPLRPQGRSDRVLLNEVRLGLAAGSASPAPGSDRSVSGGFPRPRVPGASVRTL